MDDLVGPLRAVSVLDPAIDLEATPVEVYRITRAPELVTVLPGEHAKWATLRPLTVGEFAMCDSMPSNPAKLLQAFRLSCLSVENFAAPGVALYPTKAHQMPDGRERRVWADDELQRLVDALGMAYVYELGNLAYERAVEGNGWGGGVFFTLPLSSEHGLARRLRLHAAQKRETGGTHSSESSAKSSTETPAAS